MAKVFYVPGTVRWRRHTASYDVRAYRPAKGWVASAYLLDTHPITGKQLRYAQWWIRDTFTGRFE